MRKSLLICAILLIMEIIVAASAEAHSENGLPSYADKNPPSSYVESIYGWYNHDVIARLMAHDGRSGIASLSYAIDGTGPRVSYTGSAELHFATEGVHMVEYSSMDNAGNIEQPKISLVKIDISAPDVSILSPSRRSYLHSDIIVLDFSSTDSLSGIYSITGKINGTQVAPSQVFDMLILAPGIHEFNVLTMDNAGNIGSRNVNFTVVSNIESLIALNNRAMTKGWIKDTGTASSLKQKLTLTKHKIDAGQKESANNMIKSYMDEIESRRGKTITEYGADILTKEAAYVYIFNV